MNSYLRSIELSSKTLKNLEETLNLLAEQEPHISFTLKDLAASARIANEITNTAVKEEQQRLLNKLNSSPLAQDQILGATNEENS